MAVILIAAIICGIMVPSVQSYALVAKKADFYSFTSSQLNTPHRWTASISGKTMSVQLWDSDAPDGLEVWVNVSGTGIGDDKRYYSGSMSLSLDLGRLSDGAYTVVFYQAPNLNSYVTSFAEYSFRIDGNTAYFTTPAGQSETDYISRMNSEYDPSDYNGLSRIYYGSPDIAPITDKAVELCSGVSSDLEKAAIIHDWIAGNISYDMESLYAGSTSNAADPVWAFSNRRAVCSGYARIAKIMFSAVGIACINVAGVSSTSTYITPGTDYDDSTHEWNLVWLDNSWRIVDTTWDSYNKYYGVYENAGSGRTTVTGMAAIYTYFCASPEVFGYDHLTTEIIDYVSRKYVPPVPDPVTPDPVTPNPATPDPVTPDPVTPDPVTTAPSTPSPDPEHSISGTAILFTEYRNDKSSLYVVDDGIPAVLIFGGVGSCGITNSAICGFATVAKSITGPCRFIVFDMKDNDPDFVVEAMNRYEPEGRFEAALETDLLTITGSYSGIKRKALSLTDFGKDGNNWYTMPLVAYVDQYGTIVAATTGSVIDYYKETDAEMYAVMYRNLSLITTVEIPVGPTEAPAPTVPVVTTVPQPEPTVPVITTVPQPEPTVPVVTTAPQPEPTAPAVTCVPEPEPETQPTETPSPNVSPEPTKEPTPTPVPLDKNVGKVVKSNGGKYEIVGKKVAYARYIGPVKKKAKTVTIEDTVTVDGVEYPVKSVYSKALYKNKYIRSVIIGDNVTAIGKKAFYGCKKLNSITITGTLLKSVGSKAFAKIGKNVSMTVPVAMIGKYGDLISGAGSFGMFSIKTQ